MSNKDFVPSSIPESIEIKQIVRILNNLIIAAEKLREHIRTIERDQNRIFYDKFYEP